VRYNYEKWEQKLTEEEDLRQRKNIKKGKRSKSPPRINYDYIYEEVFLNIHFYIFQNEI